MSHHQHHSCIEACVACAQECEHCGAACLEESDVTALAECIRVNRDCAEMCWLIWPPVRSSPKPRMSFFLDHPESGSRISQ